MLSRMARYNEGVLQAMARVESEGLPIQSCPLPSLVRRLEADPDPACVLTKRAADGGYAPRPKRVCPFGFFLRSEFVLPSPAAANASRWAESVGG